jgi:predicted nucleic acid-binding protein
MFGNFGAAGTMIFDSDVLIWVFRGNVKAAQVVRAEANRSLSIIGYMELLQGVRDKREAKAVRVFLANLEFEVLPLSAEIGHRAAIYIEEYALASGLRLGDALTAATATENRTMLCTGNQRHYGAIRDLEMKLFTP